MPCPLSLSLSRRDALICAWTLSMDVGIHRLIVHLYRNNINAHKARTHYGQRNKEQRRMPDETSQV